MAQTNVKTQTGNRLLVMLNNVQIGLLQNVKLNDDYHPEPASGIGDIHVQEWVPTLARHTVTVQAMVLKTGSLAKAGIAAENGDAVLQGLVFDIVVQDKDTGQTLRKYVSCSYASGDVELRKHAIVM